MGNSKTAYYGLPNELLNFLAGDHGQGFDFCLFGEVVNCDHYILECGVYCSIAPIKSIPQTMKCQGKVIEVSLSGCNRGMLENLWHLSHFFAKFMALTFIVG